MLDVGVRDFSCNSDFSSRPSDNANGRVFPKLLDDNASLTTVGCIESCSALNYTIAGLEFSVQCMVRFARLHKSLRGV